MSQKIKVAIVDDNVSFCGYVANFLQEAGGFEIVGKAYDGLTGLQMILESTVDVALLDIVLPNKDGIFILEELKKQPDKKPACIMLTGVNQDRITKKALDNGADYFVLKPFDMDLLARRIREIYELKSQAYASGEYSYAIEKTHTTEDIVSDILRKIPIATNIKGYNYLKHAILMAIEDPTVLDGITKVLYPDVAKRFTTTPTRVERAVRHAIEVAWARGCADNYYSTLNVTAGKSIRPTNSEFISSVTEYFNTHYREK